MDANTPFLKAAMSARLIAVFLATGVCLSGCESQTAVNGQPVDHLAELIQTIKDIKVEDDSGTASPQAVGAQAKGVPSVEAQASNDATGYLDYWRKGAEIALDTGRDIAMSDDGLISVRPKFEIKLVSASDARAQYVAPTKLDVVPHKDESVAPTPISATVSPSSPQSMPSLPIGIEKQVLEKMPAKSEKAAIKLSDKAPANGRLIQIGAFSTLEAAQGAMALMLSSRPDLKGLSPRLETVSTPEGKRVRVKLGPVKDEATAERLCQDLKVHDQWCVKAG